jgi:uncharacterized sulfatase
LHIEPRAFDYYKVLPGQGKYFDPSFHEKGKGPWPNNKVPTERHSTDVITDLSIEYIKRLDKSRPFFLMHHYKAPHDFFEWRLLWLTAGWAVWARISGGRTVCNCFETTP